MKRLLVASASGMGLMRSDRADALMMFSFRFVSGPLPSPDEFENYVAARSEKHGPRSHWSDFVCRWHHGSKARKDLALFEFCEPYEAIDWDGLHGYEHAVLPPRFPPARRIQ